MKKRNTTKKIIPCMLSGMMLLSGFTQYVYADEVDNEPIMSDSFTDNLDQATETVNVDTTTDENSAVIEEVTDTNNEAGDSSLNVGTNNTDSNGDSTGTPSDNGIGDGNGSNSESSLPKEDAPKKDEITDSDKKQDEEQKNTDNSTTSSENKDTNQSNEGNNENEEKQPQVQPQVENKEQISNSNTSNVNVENKTEQAVKNEGQNNVTKYSPVTAVPSSATVNYGYNDSYADTWYHPTLINALGYTGEVKNAIKLDGYVTGNWNQFTIASNPFQRGQCTYFAWSRFYQVYGYDSGARGNGKTNAAEIVKAHSSQFKLSSTPAAGAVFSYEKNSLLPQYGHVGFVESYDEETDTVYISEGNVTINGTSGNIYIHKMKFSTLKKMYPDIVFAVPNQPMLSKIEGTISNKKAYGLKKKARRVYTKTEWKRIKASVNKNLHKV